MGHKKNKHDQQTGLIQGVKAKEQHGHVAQEREPLSSQHSNRGMPEERHTKTNSPSTHKDKVTIFLDNQPYYIDRPQVSAAEIRKLPLPPIGSDKEIFHIIGGSDEGCRPKIVTINCLLLELNESGCRPTGA